jgi:DNA topoisomerase-1
LVEFFTDLFDYGFTAQMEEALDEIANGQKGRLATLERFWTDLTPALTRAKAEMPTVVVNSDQAKAEPVGQKCPECGSDLVKRHGRHGPFLGCSNYPKCKYIQRRKARVVGTCPQCGGELVTRKGRYGSFVGCANYPACKHVQRA